MQNSKSQLTIRQNGFEVEYVPLVRLFERDPKGRLIDLREEYELRELGGTIPQPGDRIVDPGVLAGRDRQLPENRIVYEVVHRYFMPRYPKFPLEKSETIHQYIALEVSVRSGTENEENVYNN